MKREWQLNQRTAQFVNPSMNREEVINIAERAGRTLLRQICQKYDFQFFSGSTDSAFVTKQAP
jgi:methyltransferase-like protein